MADLNEMLVAWTGEIDSFMYTYILVILLVFVGIYYTIRTKAVQIRYIKDMFTQLTEKKHVPVSYTHLFGTIAGACRLLADFLGRSGAFCQANKAWMSATASARFQPTRVKYPRHKTA